MILFVDTGCNLSFISFVSACDSVSFLGPSVATSAVSGRLDFLGLALIVGIYGLVKCSPSYFADHEFVGTYHSDVNIIKLR